MRLRISESWVVVHIRPLHRAHETVLLHFQWKIRLYNSAQRADKSLSRQGLLTRLHRFLGSCRVGLLVIAQTGDHVLFSVWMIKERTMSPTRLCVGTFAGLWDPTLDVVLCRWALHLDPPWMKRADSSIKLFWMRQWYIWCFGYNAHWKSLPCTQSVFDFPAWNAIDRVKERERCNVNLEERNKTTERCLKPCSR